MEILNYVYNKKVNSNEISCSYCQSFPKTIVSEFSKQRVMKHIHTKAVRYCAKWWDTIKPSPFSSTSDLCIQLFTFYLLWHTK